MWVIPYDKKKEKKSDFTVNPQKKEKKQRTKKYCAGHN